MKKHWFVILLIIEWNFADVYSFFFYVREEVVISNFEVFDMYADNIFLLLTISSGPNFS